MKKILLFTFNFLLALTISAQSLLPIKYGFKIGVNQSNIHTIPKEGVKKPATFSKIGISGGFYMQIPLNDKLYINPELLYSQKGASFDYNYTHNYNINQRDEYSTTNDLILSYIEFNPSISYKANKKLGLNIGPGISYLISSEYIYNENPDNILLNEGMFSEEAIDLGLNIGILYYLTEDILLDTKIYSGIIKTGSLRKPIDLLSDESSFNIKNKGFSFAIAYLF